MKKQDIKYLKAEAHHLKPIFQIGKEGVSDNLLDGLSKALDAHELVKINVLKTSPQTKDVIIAELKTMLDCEIIDSIGRVITIYRLGEKNRYEI